MTPKKIAEEIVSLCGKLKKSMDVSEVQNYILPMIFYKYMSDNLSQYTKDNWHEDGFDYSTVEDEKALQIKSILAKRIGYFMLPSQLFCNIRKKASESPEEREKLHENLKSIFKDIEESSNLEKLKHLLANSDWNNLELGENTLKRNENIMNLMNIVGETSAKYGKSFDHNLGNIYEFLIGEYAMRSGKRGGDFYTPSRVSELVCKIALKNQNDISNVYDPTCGSGSLLLKFRKIYGEDVKMYGQEKNVTTYNLCRMNMFIHGVSFVDFDIALGDTLENPKHSQKFSTIICNIPYSLEWKGEKDISFANDERFVKQGGLAPQKYSDFAFIQHSLDRLDKNGKAVIICATGIINRSGKESAIKKWFVNQNYVESIIYLPANLFYGTFINTIILVLNKSKSDNDILFINAQDIYTKQKNQNELSEENIEQILELYEKRENQDFFSKRVSIEEIKKNDWNLSIGTYVQKDIENKIVDIKALNKDINESIIKMKLLEKKVSYVIDEILQNNSDNLSEE